MRNAEMLIEITGDGELKRLLEIEHGFLVDIDYPTKTATVHKISCRFCDPEKDGGMKPSSKKENATGEFWFSNTSKPILKKADELNTKGYTITYCEACKPMDSEEQ
jgi:hypothetical protein